MIEETDNEESDDGDTLAYIFGREPDYQEWPPAGEFAPLSNAVCYAIGLHLKKKERPASEAANEATYSVLLNHAKSEIKSERLIGYIENGEHWVQVQDFYRWIKQQDYHLPPEFLARDPFLGKKPAPTRPNIVQSPDTAWRELANQYGKEIHKNNNRLNNEKYLKKFMPGLSKKVLLAEADGHPRKKI